MSCLPKRCSWNLILDVRDKFCIHLMSLELSHKPLKPSVLQRYSFCLYQRGGYDQYRSIWRVWSLLLAHFVLVSFPSFEFGNGDEISTRSWPRCTSVQQASRQIVPREFGRVSTSVWTRLSYVESSLRKNSFFWILQKVASEVEERVSELRCQNRSVFVWLA